MLGQDYLMTRPPGTALAWLWLSLYQSSMLCMLCTLWSSTLENCRTMQWAASHFWFTRCNTATDG